MSTLTLSSFNPFQFANRLKSAGVPEKQAEVEAEVLHDALAAHAHVLSDLESQIKSLASDTKRDAGQMATKGDVAEVRGEIAEVRGEIAEVRGDIRLLKWMFGFVLAGIASLVLKAYF